MSKIFGTYATSVITTIKWILISIILIAIGKTGYTVYTNYANLTASVAKQAKMLEDQKTTIATLNDANKQLNNEVNLLKGSQDLTDAVAVGTAEQQQKAKDSLTSIVEIRKADEENLLTNKIIKVKKPAPPGSKTKTVTENIIVEAAEIPKELSTIRINSIWKSYCSSNAPRNSTALTCTEILKTD